MRLRKLVLTYLVLVGVPLLTLVVVLALGGRLAAPHAAAGIPQPHSSKATENIPLFLFVGQIAVILVVSRLVGYFFRKIRQPHVVGEMLAGILLGPSLFGSIAPVMSAALFPSSNLYLLNAISQMGLVLFMFLVGLELNPKELYSHGEATVLVSHVSIA